MSTIAKSEAHLRCAMSNAASHAPPSFMGTECAGLHANENYNGIHHIGVLCKNIQESLQFYQNILGELYRSTCAPQILDRLTDLIAHTVLCMAASPLHCWILPSQKPSDELVLLISEMLSAKSFQMNMWRTGMDVNEARPDDKLPYKGAWLWVGEEMIHLMELPNPDPEDGRPEHGGRDRHLCLVCTLVSLCSPALLDIGLNTEDRLGSWLIFIKMISTPTIRYATSFKRPAIGLTDMIYMSSWQAEQHNIYVGDFHYKPPLLRQTWKDFLKRKLYIGSAER